MHNLSGFFIGLFPAVLIVMQKIEAISDFKAGRYRYYGNDL